VMSAPTRAAPQCRCRGATTIPQPRRTRQGRLPPGGLTDGCRQATAPGRYADYASVTEDSRSERHPFARTLASNAGMRASHSALPRRSQRTRSESTALTPQRSRNGSSCRSASRRVPTTHPVRRAPHGRHARSDGCSAGSASSVSRRLSVPPRWAKSPRRTPHGQRDRGHATIRMAGLTGKRVMHR
jgi:hypothetical protein